VHQKNDASATGSPTGRSSTRAKRQLGRLAVVAGAGLLAVMVAVGGSLASASSSQKLTSLKLVYDFPDIDNEAIPFAVGEKLGYYRSVGLKVSIVLPPDDSTTIKMLTAGTGDIGFDSITDEIFARRVGIPVVSIANYSQSNNWGLFAPPGKSINIHHLRGKSIGIYGDSWTKTMMPFVLKAAGLSASQVHQVLFENDAIKPMLAGRLDIATDTVNYAQPEIQGDTGKKGAQLLGTSFGVPNIPIWDFTALTSWLKQHGAEAKAFLSATRKAFEYSIAHPKQAVADFTSVYPKNGATALTNLRGWIDLLPALKTSDGQLFIQRTSEWTELISALKASKLITSAAPASTYFTNKYVGS
jgi:NitT/TauT family transport system substrate-binding protein